MKLQIPVIFLTTAATALAQTPELAGFIFANATGLPGKTILKVNGRDVSMGGYLSGMATSGLGFPTGSITVEAETEGAAAARENLNIIVGKCPILFARVEESEDPQSPEPKLKFFQPTERPEQFSAYSSRLFYLPRVAAKKAAPLTLEISGKPVVMKPFEAFPVEGKNFSMRWQGQELPDPDLELPGNYSIAIFHNADGSLGTVVVPEIVYRW